MATLEIKNLHVEVKSHHELLDLEIKFKLNLFLLHKNQFFSQFHGP